MKRLSVCTVVVIGSIACSNERAADAPSTSTEAVTFWDVEPLFETHCMACHQEGGLGPFRLDDYQAAKTRAPLIRDFTQRRVMPPWSATSDGSCGDFVGSLALQDDQIARIAAWADGGATEGTPRAVQLPQIPSLANATEFSTPLFTPVIAGGPLTASDEYRCFMLDSGVAETVFLTASDVAPGAPDLVHHVLGMIVDPNAPAEDNSGLTNLQRMQALDAESPDRDGWPCFGMAGEGVGTKALPVIWAPGQGIVELPPGTGIPLQPTDKLVVQVHYNLAELSTRGKSDQTTIKFRTASRVEKVGFFLTEDPFLGSLYSDKPESLAPGLPSVKYHFTAGVDELGLQNVPHVEVQGVFPHMHQLGHAYRMSFSNGTESQCAVDVRNWNFHWQRMYFYRQPYALTATSSIDVTCDYDTSSRTEPVLSGWGTSNEMCLATLFITVPIEDLTMR